MTVKGARLICGDRSNGVAEGDIIYENLNQVIDESWHRWSNWWSHRVLVRSEENGEMVRCWSCCTSVKESGEKVKLSSSCGKTSIIVCLGNVRIWTNVGINGNDHIFPFLWLSSFAHWYGIADLQNSNYLMVDDDLNQKQSPSRVETIKLEAASCVKSRHDSVRAEFFNRCNNVWQLHPQT
jgi:hypothetical protein